MPSPTRWLPGAYRPLFANTSFRRLMPVFALSDLGDGMSTVAVAWLALTIAPESAPGRLVGIAVAAYVLPGAIGALVLGRWMRRLSARRLLIADGWLRALFLGTIPAAWAAGVLTPARYVILLAASSLLHAWGKAGKHALFAPLLPDDQRLAANAILSTSIWTSVIAGPAVAGLLAGTVSPAWIIGLLVVTWFFNLFFGPVEVALPLFVAHDGHPAPSLVGFGTAGVIYGPYSALSFTLLQERAPADSLTTVLAARSAVLLTASPPAPHSAAYCSTAPAPDR